jgi:predicted  nucleic acid-binding Zn-ribbon protein
VDAIWPAALGAAGVIIAGVIAYLATRKQTETEEEIALRIEGRAMRDELREAYKNVKAELEEVRLDAEVSRKAVVQLSLEVVALRTEIATLRARQDLR